MEIENAFFKDAEAAAFTGVPCLVLPEDEDDFDLSKDCCDPSYASIRGELSEFQKQNTEKKSQSILVSEIEREETWDPITAKAVGKRLDKRFSDQKEEIQKIVDEDDENVGPQEEKLFWKFSRLLFTACDITLLNLLSNSEISQSRTRVAVHISHLLSKLNLKKKKKGTKKNKRLKLSIEDGVKVIREDESEDDATPRTEGLSTCRILILCPVRTCAFIWGNLIKDLSTDDPQVENFKNFTEMFHWDEKAEKAERLKKGDVFLPGNSPLNLLHRQNPEDNFIFGFRLNTTTQKIAFDSKLELSDIIVASPLAVAAKLEKHPDTRILSSIHLLVLDYPELLFVQNQKHLEKTLENLNVIPPSDKVNFNIETLLPSIAAGDLQRMRQNIVLSSGSMSEEIQNLLREFCPNVRGKATICREIGSKLLRESNNDQGVGFHLTIQKMPIVEDEEGEIDVTSSAVKFYSKILPTFLAISHDAKTLILVPSETEFLVIRHILRKNLERIAELWERSSAKEIKKTKKGFQSGEYTALLTTERYLAYQRKNMVGNSIGQIIVCDPPIFPETLNRIINAQKALRLVHIIYNEHQKDTLRQLIGS